MNLLILAAAGAGSRFGAHIPKQFQSLSGRPLYLHSLSTIAPMCHRGVVVVPAGWVKRVEDEVGEFPWGERLRVVEGGAERQDSVWRGLRTLEAVDGLVLVHDAARPYVSRALVQRILQAAQAHGAAVPGLPPADTIKEVDGGRVVRTIDRQRLRAVQTPQGFRLELLKAAFEQAIKDGFLGTDEASLVERIGRTVRVVEGEAENLKVTWPGDL